MNGKTDIQQESIDSGNNGVKNEAQNNASVVLPTERGRLTRWAAVPHVLNKASMGMPGQNATFSARLVKNFSLMCRFGRWVWSWAVPGLGMFNESYYIFSVGNVKPIWTEQYPECWKVVPLDMSVCPLDMPNYPLRAPISNAVPKLLMIALQLIATLHGMRMAGRSGL